MRKLCIRLECQTESTNKKKRKTQNFLLFRFKEGSEWLRKEGLSVTLPEEQKKKYKMPNRREWSVQRSKSPLF